MEHLVYLNRVNLALSRAAAVSVLRDIDEANPNSWEFSGFSQNGEDGIIDYLCQRISDPNYYFVEVGASDGIENNTSWLAFARKYEGIMFEGSSELVRKFNLYLQPMLLGVEAYELFVSLDNVNEIISRSLYKDPDVFSLDIDGNDYYVAKRLLEQGFRPKLFVVEYNSAYGPEHSLTIKYDKNFMFDYNSYEDYLYFGVSITAWRKLFEEFGYIFVAVERRGVNGFFVDPKWFDEEFLNNLKGLQYAENFYQALKYKVNWEGQFELIKNRREYLLI